MQWNERSEKEALTIFHVNVIYINASVLLLLFGIACLMPYRADSSEPIMNQGNKGILSREQVVSQ